MSTEIVATLVASPGAGIAPGLLETLTASVKATRNTLRRKGVVDIFSDMAVDDARKILIAKIGDEPIDVLVQLASKRAKKLLIADMESTMIEQEMLDELAGMIGVGEKVAGITRRAMNGELDFISALKERVALLKGQPASILEEAAEGITLMPGAEALMKAMKTQDAQCWLVSGGFNFFVSIVAHRLGFDKYFANDLPVRDGKIMGVVPEPIVDRSAKKSCLEKACRELNISPADCLAVGDGANDVLMLEACNKGGGLGVAFQAKPKVRAAVANQINYGDLSALVYAQGMS